MNLLGEVPPNNGMHRTRNQRAFYHQSSVRAGDAGRWASLLSSSSNFKMEINLSLGGALL